MFTVQSLWCYSLAEVHGSSSQSCGDNGESRSNCSSWCLLQAFAKAAFPTSRLKNPMIHACERQMEVARGMVDLMTVR